jgi:uncharacterized YigZ family protein
MFSIKNPVEHELKIKRSRFLCQILPVNNVESAKNHIRLISNLHHNASHNCWCYRLGKSCNIEHSSDAGEPAGTAGKPMLGQLKKAELSNVIAVVSRYFGGVKLGVSGLIEAYSASVSETLALAERIELIEVKTYQVKTTYDYADRIKHDAQVLQAKILKTNYSTDVTFIFEVEENVTHNFDIFLLTMAKNQKIIIL